LQELFSGLLAPGNTPVAYLLKGIDRSRFLCSPLTLGSVSLFIVAVLPTNYLFGHCGP
jgi:hypothetical protein